MNTRPQGADDVHEAFVYDSLVAAFHRLEELVSRGLISWYGISSSGLSCTASGQLTIALDQVLKCARVAGGEGHHFAVIQHPMSVFDVESPGEEGLGSLQALARTSGLGVLAGRPLHAVVEGRLVRLTDFATEGSARIRRLVRAAVVLEEEFSEGLGKAFEIEGREGRSRLFDNANRLLDVANTLNDYVLWREFVEDVLEQELSGLIGQIDNGLTGPLKVVWSFWLERYIKAISQLVDGLTLRCARASQRQSRRIAKGLRPLVPEASDSAALAQLGVAVVRDLPGVDAVLVGMRRIQYAIEAMETMHWAITPQSPKRVCEITRQLIKRGA